MNFFCEKYLKICKVAQNFSFFEIVKKEIKKNFLLKNRHFWQKKTIRKNCLLFEKIIFELHYLIIVNKIPVLWYRELRTGSRHPPASRSTLQWTEKSVDLKGRVTTNFSTWRDQTTPEFSHILISQIMVRSNGTIYFTTPSNRRLSKNLLE